MKNFTFVTYIAAHLLVSVYYNFTQSQSRLLASQRALSVTIHTPKCLCGLNFKYNTLSWNEQMRCGRLKAIVISNTHSAYASVLVIHKPHNNTKLFIRKYCFLQSLRSIPKLGHSLMPVQPILSTFSTKFPQKSLSN